MSQNLIVYDQDQVFVDYINGVLGVKFELHNTRTVSHIRRNDDGTYTILAVVLFNNWATHHCEASIASSSPHWATWKYINAVYRYVFDNGRQRVHFVVEPHNTAAITMHKKLGHQFEGEMRDVYGEDKNGLMFAFTKRDFVSSRWYERNKAK